MLKSSTGTDRSDHTTTWARIAVAEALLTENRVVTPLALDKSTSKYGSSSVAAGTSSMVQMTACAWPPRASRPRSARHINVLFMPDNLLELVVEAQIHGHASNCHSASSEEITSRSKY